MIESLFFITVALLIFQAHQGWRRTWRLEQRIVELEVAKTITGERKEGE